MLCVLDPPVATPLFRSTSRGLPELDGAETFCRVQNTKKARLVRRKLSSEMSRRGPSFRTPTGRNQPPAPPRPLPHLYFFPWRLGERSPEGPCSARRCRSSDCGSPGPSPAPTRRGGGSLPAFFPALPARGRAFRASSLFSRKGAVRGRPAAHPPGESEGCSGGASVAAGDETRGERRRGRLVCCAERAAEVPVQGGSLRPQPRTVERSPAAESGSAGLRPACGPAQRTGQPVGGD